MFIFIYIPNTLFPRTTSNAHLDGTNQHSEISEVEIVDTQEVPTQEESQGQLLAECDNLETAEFIIGGPSSSSRNGTSVSGLCSPGSDIAVNLVPKMSSTPSAHPNGKRKRDANKNDSEEVAATLINAINKLTNDKTPDKAGDSFESTFIQIP